MEESASFKLGFFLISATFLIVQHGTLGFETWQEKAISPHFSCNFPSPTSCLASYQGLRGTAVVKFFFSSARSLVAQNLPMWSEAWQGNLPMLNPSKSNKWKALIKSRKLLSWFTMMLPPTCWSSLDRCPNLLLSHLQPILLTAIAEFFFPIGRKSLIPFLNLFYLNLWVTLKHHLQASLLSKLHTEPWG